MARTTANLDRITGIEQTDPDLKNDESNNNVDLDGTLAAAQKVMQSITGDMVHNEDEFELPEQKPTAELTPDEDPDGDAEGGEPDDDEDFAYADLVKGMFEDDEPAAKPKPKPKTETEPDQPKLIDTPYGQMTAEQLAEVGRRALAGELRSPAAQDSGKPEGIDYEKLAAAISSANKPPETDELDTILNDPEADPRDRQLAATQKQVKKLQGALETLMRSSQSDEKAAAHSRVQGQISQLIGQYVEGQEWLKKVAAPEARSIFEGTAAAGLAFAAAQQGWKEVPREQVQPWLMQLATTVQKALSAERRKGAEETAAYFKKKMAVKQKMGSTSGGRTGGTPTKNKGQAPERKPDLLDARRSKSAQADAYALGRSILESVGS